MALRENQQVWFWKDGEGRNRLPEPAIVTKVRGEKTVDLWVFCQHGAQRVETMVAVRSDTDQQPLVRYATMAFARREPDEKPAAKPAAAGSK